ncbi:MAG: 23S rRNA (pseudouridine(1915)-N(3))-methyltransferase RlmH [Pseudomonadota bacterium]
MRLDLIAVGRLKAGPEADLVRGYAARATAAGRALALGPVDITEIDERKARDRAQQSDRLAEAVPAGAAMILLDERGKTLSSEAFSALLAAERDAGRPGLAFLIGGADGHSPDLRQRADRMLSFGPMVWPHVLARVMLAEQLYRAISILGGSPYHRA